MKEQKTFGTDDTGRSPVSTGEAHVLPYTADAMAQDMTSDLYPSFRITQGSSYDLQPDVFAALAVYYASATDDPDLFKEAVRKFEDNQDFQYLMPKRHTRTDNGRPIDDNMIQRQYREKRTEFADYLYAVQDPEPDAPYVVELGRLKPSDELLDRIVHRMLTADLWYVEKGREGRDPAKHDVYESYVRSLLLERGLHGSPQMEALREDLRTRVIRLIMSQDDTQPKTDMGALIALWQDKNPGQVFWQHQ